MPALPTVPQLAWLLVRPAASLDAKDRGGQGTAAMHHSLIVTTRMNDGDPQAWLADVLRRIADHPAQRLDNLLPWNWARLAATPIDQAA